MGRIGQADDGGGSVEKRGRKMKRFASFMLIADPPLCSGGSILIQFEILCFHDDNSNAPELKLAYDQSIIATMYSAEPVVV